MKKFTSFYSAIIFMIISGAASAASLDGTASVNYQTSPYVFRDGDTARGIVCFGKGFTVVPSTNHGSNLFLDTNISISGGIDLRGTSTMTLLHDVWLDSGVTFSDSGRIYSYGSSLIMGGDLTIPADKVLHCGGNLIIDGNGHTLTLGSGAQLFLDNASTLTLRNMVVKTTHQYPGAPALTLSSTFSKLALDNVVLALSDDLYVNRGQLFIHNDVMVTGTSALVYRSTSPSFITSQGCLLFDNGTTFSYAPACNDKDLFLMADASSSLVLDGCSLKTTHTGMRLTKGRLYMDNKVVINSTADMVVNTTTPAVLAGSLATGSLFLWGVFWSPDGKYVAGVNQGSSNMQIFACLEGTPVKVGGNTSVASSSRTCSWSPDGKYVVVANYSSSSIQFFSMTAGVPTKVGPDFPLTGHALCCAWSPDGKYVAVGLYSGGVQVLAFSGSRPTRVGGIASTGTEKQSVCWSPDGKYLAVVGAELEVFAFFGGTPIKVGNAVGGSASCAWSPDGKYITTLTSNTLNVFAFSGGTLTQVGSGVSLGGLSFMSSWSPDGKYIVVANYGLNCIQFFAFLGGTPIRVGSNVSMTNQPLECRWSPDGKYVAVANYEGNKIEIYRVNYVVDSSTQVVSNGIVWGNRAAGEAYDLDIHVLSGARVEVSGNIFHDPA